MPDRLLGEIVTAAEGNPFYAEELIEMLVDDGVIHTDESTGVWHSDASSMGRLQVPSTLMAVLQARLDRLPLAEGVVVQQASVVGRTFWTAALQALQGTEVPLARELAALSRRELIHLREVSTFAGTDEYQFKHALMREAAYSTVLIRTRRAYHGLVASWLVEGTKTSRRSDESGMIARHYERAGEIEKAATWYLQAAKGPRPKGHRLKRGPSWIGACNSCLKGNTSAAGAPCWPGATSWGPWARSKPGSQTTRHSWR